MTPAALRWILNLWPPFLAAGIHVTHLSQDWRHARVELRMRPWNRNYVGTHFGGSLFAMTDPFWMILVKERVGRDYIVWDSAGAIEFVKPGKGTAVATFELDDATVDTIREAAADGDKVLHWFETAVRDGAGEVVARVRKQVYVRRKRSRSAGAPQSS
jgi:acyl-coenzyme A thioesterase PaaI-like protein